MVNFNFSKFFESSLHDNYSIISNDNNYCIPRQIGDTLYNAQPEGFKDIIANRNGMNTCFKELKRIAVFRNEITQMEINRVILKSLDFLYYTMPKSSIEAYPEASFLTELDYNIMSNPYNKNIDTILKNLYFYLNRFDKDDIAGMREKALNELFATLSLKVLNIARVLYSQK